MDLQGKKSSQSKKMWIIIGAFIALVVLGAAAYAVMTATMPKKQQETTNNTATRSDEEIKKDIFRAKDKLDKAIEQEKVDRKGVEDAINDHVNRVKLTN
jgi:flagellar basal body-associated protein FliL